MFVKIKPGLSHAQYKAGEVFDASPAEVESFGDKFDVVEQYVASDADTPRLVKISGPNVVAGIFTEPATFDVDAAPLANLVQSFGAPPEINATDAAIKLAAENPGVVLAEVAGSGKDGRITTADVRKALDGDA